MPLSCHKIALGNKKEHPAIGALRSEPVPSLEQSQQNKDALLELQDSRFQHDRQHCKFLAEQLVITPVSFLWERQHRFLAALTIDRLIDLEPDCPRWASQRVDQLLVLLEETW